MDPKCPAGYAQRVVSDSGTGWRVELHQEVRQCFQQVLIQTQGETFMGERGSKDKGQKEQKKKPQQTLKEKRKAKQDKKGGSSGG